MTQQLSLLDAAPAKPLKPSQQEVMEALRVLIVASDTSAIQEVLASHNIPREKNCIAKRLTELERLGLVERVGKNHLEHGVARTTWRRRS